MPDPTDPTGDPVTSAGFGSAEAFLASLGIEREPIAVPPEPTPDAPSDAGAAADPGDDGRAPVGVREARRLAAEAPPPPTAEQAPPTAAAPDLGDEIARAVAYARRATAQAPMSESRLRDRLARREYPRAVIDRAIERCRAERLVDDPALVAALVAERRRKDHAPSRIRRDLRARGFGDDLIDRELAPVEAQDREAQAFAAASTRTASLRGLDAQTAFRRLTGYLARRGYPEGLARKVARQVVYVDREQEQVAGH